MELTSSTTVTRLPEEVYACWLALERLPVFTGYLDEVRVTGPSRSHWRASAPFGRSVEWEAETRARRTAARRSPARPDRCRRASLPTGGGIWEAGPDPLRLPVPQQR
jgi:hypothetical protein